ncbi:heavy metal-binding domain-containing protein [Lactobacillus sp. Sy-1]|uniref:heavy metal-binding domain-containing protein n=1 Tax=Lactobacillus sp. Sy-1 TaxID=2109645 RepID=UPI001C5A8795|nr:heavy metal-binding domain-containing protein [Lactobacillus sp. Sy-1]MBW1605864.1 heavy metal-binding domain-containing protein [Lactobacillus sp. Sy-1]
MLVSTTENIGKKYEVIGEVFGMTTQSRNIGSNMAAGVKNLFGGEIKGYTKMLEDARDESVQRLKDNAEKMGADAVVVMRFDSGSIGNDMQTVAAYGTAVKFVE